MCDKSELVCGRRRGVLCGLLHCCYGMAVPGVRTEDYALNGVLLRSPARLPAGPAAAAAGTV